MNVFTVAVFAVALLWNCGAAGYVWSIRRTARSRWIVRFAFAVLAFYGASCVTGLVLFHGDALSGSVIAEMLLVLGQSASVAFLVRENTRPIDPALLRYPYRASKQEIRLLLISVAALSTPVVAVLVVVAVHSAG